MKKTSEISTNNRNSTPSHLETLNDTKGWNVMNYTQRILGTIVGIENHSGYANLVLETLHPERVFDYKRAAWADVAWKRVIIPIVSVQRKIDQALVCLGPEGETCIITKKR